MWREQNCPAKVQKWRWWLVQVMHGSLLDQRCWWSIVSVLCHVHTWLGLTEINIKVVTTSDNVRNTPFRGAVNFRSMHIDLSCGYWTQFSFGVCHLGAVEKFVNDPVKQCEEIELAVLLNRAKWDHLYRFLVNFDRPFLFQTSLSPKPIREMTNVNVFTDQMPIAV